MPASLRRNHARVPHLAQRYESELRSLVASPRACLDSPAGGAHGIQGVVGALAVQEAMGAHCVVVPDKFSVRQPVYAQCRLVSRVRQVPSGEVVIVVLSLVFHGE